MVAESSIEGILDADEVLQVRYSTCLIHHRPKISVFGLVLSIRLASRERLAPLSAVVSRSGCSSPHYPPVAYSWPGTEVVWVLCASTLRF